MKWGFVQSKADPCLFVYIEREIRLFVYIDDLVATVPKCSDLDQFYTQFDICFNTKDLGEIKKIFRVQITKN